MSANKRSKINGTGNILPLRDASSYLSPLTIHKYWSVLPTFSIISWKVKSVKGVSDAQEPSYFFDNFSILC